MPLGSAGGASGSGVTGPSSGGGPSSSVMSSTGTTTVISMVLPIFGATTRDRPAAGEERADLVDRPDRRGQPDPLGRPGEQRVEPFQRQRQVRAALGAGHRVHLVDDHRLHPAQRLPGRGGEQQEQRLRRGDQHVRRRAGERAALVGRGVAGAHADRDLRVAEAEPARRLADAGERRAQVALHVDGQRLERGDVQHPAALRALRRLGLGGRAGRAPTGTRPASCPTRRGHHQRVLARRRGRHAPACASVGAANAPVNHCLVAGENSSSTSVELMNPC